jgi:MYXO-CTERM domain-containing protein
MNLRALLAAAVLLPAASSFAQATCVVEGFDRTCDGATLTFCDATAADGTAQPPVTNTIDCSEGATAVSCGDVNCSGAACDGDKSNCIGTGEGSSCIGESVFYVDADGDGQADNADAFLAITCAAGFACKTVVDGQNIADTCTASAETCTAAAARCDGDVAITCYAGGTGETAIVFNAPTLQDCATFPAGSACVVNNDDAANPFAFCDIPAPAEGEGEGEGEGAEGEGEDDGGNNRDDEPQPAPGGCFNAFGVLPAFGPLALGLLALRRRRP